MIYLSLDKNDKSKVHVYDEYKGYGDRTVTVLLFTFHIDDWESIFPDDTSNWIERLESGDQCEIECKITGVR